MWNIYDKTGNDIRCTIKALEYSGTWMGAGFVTSTIKSEEPIPFEIGDYLIYRGEKFEINYDPTALKKATRRTSGEAFVYDSVKFNNASDELTRCDFLDFVKHDNQVHFTSLPKFSFFASSVQDLADRVQVNLDRIYTGDKKWTVIVHPEHVNTTNVNIDIDNIKVWGAVELFNSKFGATLIIRGRTITVGTAGIAVDGIFAYGRGNGLYEIQRTADSDQNIITRLRAYGSSKNLPNRYYNKLTDSSLSNFLPNNMAVMNLMLPGFPENTLDPYIDSENITELGIREASIYFDGTGELEEIYPSMQGMTAQQMIDAGISVSIDAGDNGNLDEVFSAEQLTDDGTMDDLEEGKEPPPFTITLKDIGFNINDYLIAETATISMTDGTCGGREFEITKCEKQGNKYVLTCNRVYDDGLKLYFPYNNYNIKSGDKFVLLQIDMPDVYIKAASQRLLVVAKEYLAKVDYVRYSYEPKVDDIFMARQHKEATERGEPSIHDTIKEGDFMMFEDADLGIDGSIIIDTLIIKEGEDMIPKYTITLRDEKVVGSLDKMQNQIDSISKGQGGGGLTTQQIQSIIQAFGSKKFLRKDQEDVASGIIQFLQGITIGESVIDSLIAGAGIIAKDGRIQADRMELRSSLTVLELIFNRLSGMESDYSFSESGTIESVELMEDGTYNLPLRKRWDNDFTALSENDVVYGVVNDLASGSGRYYTSWLRVLHVDTAANTINAVMYPDSEVPGGKNYPPEPLMILSHRGNPVSEDRQGYWYLSSREKCICMLDGVTKPILEEHNYAVIIGKLKQLSLFDNLPINYLHSYIYCRGIAIQDILRIDYNGAPIVQHNDRGFWSATPDPVYSVSATSADTVWHVGCKWLCLINGTTDMPRYGAAGWAMIEGNPDFTIEIESSNGWYFDADKFATTLFIKGYLYNGEVTAHILDVDVEWSRDTGNVTEDNAWAVAHAEAGKSLPLTVDDLGPDYMMMTGCKFIARVLLRDGQGNYESTNFTTF